MMLLGIHIVGISLIVFIAATFAYRKGVEAGERRVLRRMEVEREDGPGAA